MQGIRVVNLRKSFNGQEVLRGVNLDIPKGMVTTIKGGACKGDGDEPRIHLV